MSAPRVLVAGIGNIFFGDDGFGVAVAQRLQARMLPEGVVVMDAGIRGIDLTYALMDDYEAAILVDTTQRGGAPGTLYVIDPTPREPALATSLLDAHALDPRSVLAFVQASGAALRSLRLVGCEPATLGSEDEPQLGLSEPVEAAVGRAVLLVEALVAEWAHAAEPSHA
jgi:hydrogenase maturation protease